MMLGVFAVAHCLLAAVLLKWKISGASAMARWMGSVRARFSRNATPPASSESSVHATSANEPLTGGGGLSGKDHHAAPKSATAGAPAAAGAPGVAAFML